ncbi:hypothetical protein JOJ87_004649 [Rhodococcus ruber]|nr:hypothetical protein [Rhodococcus ruber]
MVVTSKLPPSWFDTIMIEPLGTAAVDGRCTMSMS